MHPSCPDVEASPPSYLEARQARLRQNAQVLKDLGFDSIVHSSCSVPKRSRRDSEDSFDSSKEPTSRAMAAKRKSSNKSTTVLSSLPPPTTRRSSRSKAAQLVFVLGGDERRVVPWEEVLAGDVPLKRVLPINPEVLEAEYEFDEGNQTLVMKDEGALTPERATQRHSDWWRTIKGEAEQVLVFYENVWNKATVEKLQLAAGELVELDMSAVDGDKKNSNRSFINEDLLKAVPKLHHEFHGKQAWVDDPVNHPAPQYLQDIAIKFNVSIEDVIQLSLAPKTYGAIGVSCHWCRQKTCDKKSVCGRCCIPANGLSPPGSLCGPCLYNRWKIDVLEVLGAVESFVCPYCRDECNCSQGCMASRPSGFNTHGEIGKRAKAAGVTVNEYLKTHHNVPFGTFEHFWEPSASDLYAFVHYVVYPDGHRENVESDDRRKGFYGSTFRVPSHLYSR